MDSLSSQFANKSVQAAVSAIEIYNKPDFNFREEAFTLLMTNAWELLLKAKWLLDNDEKQGSLYEYTKDEGGTAIPKTNRSGNPITFGLTYLATKLFEDPNSGLSKACYNNLLGLVEIRDNSAHFINKDLYFGRRILEIGTASLQNYLSLIEEWFQINLSQYNFFLMPISFYHGFEAIKPSSVSLYSEQMNKLLEYLARLDTDTEEDVSHPGHHVALRLETRFVKTKDAAAITFQWTDDPDAPAITLTEEDVLKNYPWSYHVLTTKLRRRYTDFLANRKFYDLKRGLETEKKYSIVRELDPGNPKSPVKRFYNPNILQEFDKHYTKRKNVRLS